MDIFKTLDKEQLAAAKQKGPCLVIAGPGAGKTRTLAARFAHLIDNDIAPNNIFVATFTRAAATEIKARIDQAGYNTKGAMIGTFHSLALKILRQFDEHPFTVVGDGEVYDILRKSRLKRGVDIDMLKGMISAWKSEMMTPEKLGPNCSKAMKPYVQAYGNYQNKLARENKRDFDDLISSCLDLLARDEDIRYRVSSRIQAILIDEYQDIDPSQIKLVNMLMGDDHGKLWAVADEDQTIFEFRSADPKHVLDFSQRHKGAHISPLSVNYRSSPQIVSFSTQAIKHNKQRTEKDLKAYREQFTPIDKPKNASLKAKTGISFITCDTPYLEATYVTDLVRELLDKGEEPEEIAVLFRAGWLATPLQNEFAARGIPAQLAAVKDTLNSPEAKQYRALMMILANSKDIRFNTLVTSKYYQMKIRDIAQFLSGKKWDYMVTEAARMIIDIAPKTLRDDRRDQWQYTINTLAALALEAGSSKAFEQNLMTEGAPKRNRVNKGVTLSTIHGAKGCEWKHVILVGTEEGTLPHKKAVTEREIEAERRLLYVALSRAKDSIHLTYTAKRSNKGGDLISGFISPLLKLKTDEGADLVHKVDLSVRPENLDAVKSKSKNRKPGRKAQKAPPKADIDDAIPEFTA